MQPSTEKSQPNQDNWANGEDSPVVTIEYLRARLLAERSVSKAAKDRADELSKRVRELEDQLKVVSLQRKRAEKATLDVLSYLESHGVSDVSELYESGSDQEDSLCESNTGKINQDKNFDSLGTNAFGKESSGSDHESARSSSGSLSWKGRNKTAQLIEKKYFDSPTRRQTNSPLNNSSPRRRHGKSCRQVKRREVRLVVEEPNHTLKTDVQDSNRLGSSVDQAYCLDTKSVKLEQSPDRLLERDFKTNEVSLSFEDRTQAGDASSSNRRHEPSGEMERALEHQARLIGLNEAQEKAQRDWEDNYPDNHVSMQDSCEPGNHSDVTEERDENKAGVAHLGEVTTNHHDGQKEGSEGTVQRKQSSITHFNSFKLSPDADTGLKGNDSSSEMQSYRFAAASDFAFPTVSNEPIQKNENGHHSIVPHEEPHRPDGILSALQEAKLILNQQISSLPKSSESAQEDDVYGLNIPLACSRLFRVPTDLPSQAPSHSRSLLQGRSRPLSDTDGYRKTYLQGYQSMSSPMNPRISNPPYVTKLGDSARPALDFQSNPNLVSSNKLGSLPYTSSPEFSLSPNRVLSSRLPKTELGIPPSRSSLVYNYDFGPDMYR